MAPQDTKLASATPKLKSSILLSIIFTSACDWHYEHCRPSGDYEVCRYLRCRLAWALENWLWYGGAAMTSCAREMTQDGIIRV